MAFGARLQAALTLVATIDSAPVGFIALRGSDQLDMLYVYPPAARRGIASLLYDAIERLAKGRGAAALNVDASDTARPFLRVEGVRTGVAPDGLARRGVAGQHEE